MAKYIAVTNAGERMARSPVAGYAADAGWRIWCVRTILAPSIDHQRVSPRRPSPAIIMNVPPFFRIARRSLLVALVCVPVVLRAQDAASGPLQAATHLDVQGATTEAPGLMQRVIESSSAPQGRRKGDPFLHMLLAMTYETLDQRDRAPALYEKAYSQATAHNPPSAAVRPQARRKLAP